MAGPLDKLRPDLDATGLPWEVKQGTRHLKVFVGGRLACVLPKRCSDADPRNLLNSRAQIRRAARQAHA